MFLRLGELDGDISSAEAIVSNHRRRFVVPVRQPLALITQIQRCGGTLVSQLLDGHSQLHVHPSELHINKPKHSWPRLEPTSSGKELFESLREKRTREHAMLGYQKLSLAEIQSNPGFRELILPFMFADSLQEDLFARLCERFPPGRQRDVLDHYITSYFNAWIDYAGLYREPERVKYWIAFLPRLLIDAANFDRFVTDYPDGRLIVPVRDPVSWYASARAHTAEYANVENALALWETCAANALACAGRNPGIFHFVKFEDLVRSPKPTLERLVRFLGLSWEDCLAEPTFNGMSVVSDSSFGSRFGIDLGAADRTGQLDRSLADTIRARTEVSYGQLLDRIATQD